MMMRALLKNKALSGLMLILLLAAFLLLGPLQGSFFVYAEEEEACTHEHSEDCYELIPLWQIVTFGHAHSEDCYEDGELIDPENDGLSEDTVEWVFEGVGEPDDYIRGDQLTCAHAHCQTGEPCLELVGQLGETPTPSTLDNEEPPGIPSSEQLLETMDNPQIALPLLGDLAYSIDVLNSVAGGEWEQAPLVSVSPNSTVIMRLTLTNSGMVDLTSIRVYDILPRHNDNLGTWGSIDYRGVATSAASSMYFTTTSPNNSGSVPRYGLHGEAVLDLQDLQAAFWTGTVWTSAGGDSNTRAVFVDFGDLVLGPGESVNVEV
ncbi:MAG: hypothetical protein FWF91_00930, partial [Coriobacteriia bacterium]|nr:hypothetical protein [Coriobacteriia bacterium]